MNSEANAFYKWIKAATASLFFAVLVSGAIYAWWTVARISRELRTDLAQKARLVAQTVEVAHVQKLTGTESDLDNPHYLWLKQQLAAVRSANPQCRFVYLMGRKAGDTVFFFADNEPAGSKDYSPPGQIFTEAPEPFRRVFDTKQALVEAPVTDRRGTWVSALVPLTNPQTGAVVAVLGMDIDTRFWKLDIASHAALPVGLMLMMLIGVAAVYASTRPFCRDAISRRDPVTSKLLLRRVMPPLTIMVIMLIVGTWAFMYQQVQHHLHKAISDDIANVSRDLRTALDQQTRELTAAAQSIAADGIVQKGLREGDAASLLATQRPVFESLRSANNLTQLYFFDTNRVCLLRVHNPDKRGDTIDRFTALEAERTCKAASGIELGPMGVFAMRVVQPVFDGGTLVGYVELSKEISAALKTLYFGADNQLAMVISKEHLVRRNWEAGLRMLGRKSDWDRLPRSVVVYSSQGLLPDAFAACGDQAAEKLAYGESDRNIVVDGKDWRVSVAPLQDASGKKVGGLLIMRDIFTENAAFTRLMALNGTVGILLMTLLMCFFYILLSNTDAGIRFQQAELRESEENFRRSLDDSPLGVRIVAAEGETLYVNRAMLDIYGYSNLEEFRATPVEKRYTPESYIEFKKRCERRQQGKFSPSEYEVKVLRKNGEVRHLLVSRKEQVWNGQKQYQTLYLDITERKQAEEALRESEMRYRTFINATSDLVFLKDESFRYLISNRANSAFLGQPEVAVIGCTDFDLLPNAAAERCRASDLEALEKDVVVTTDESMGTNFYHTIKFQVPLAGGRMGVGGYIRDITERKHADQAKLVLEAQARRLQKAESLGRMAGAIAHHFNNQLMAVMGNMELAMEGLPRDAEPFARLSDAMQAAHKATKVSTLMLTYLGKTPATHALLDLSDICRQNLSVWRAGICDGVVLETDLPVPGPAIMADANQIQQVLANLIANAGEAIGTAGGVMHLTVKTVFRADIPAVYRFPADWQPQDQTYACLEVADTGCGIAKHDMEKLVDPFFSTKFTGRGLGLSVVMGIVRAHRGGITVESEPGHGSTFRVFLPLSMQTQAVSMESQAAEFELGSVPARHKLACTVLLADDDAAVRKLTTRMLTRLGFAVYVAQDGVETLELFRQHQVEIRCVLCNLSMPRMDGWETLTALRAMRTDLPVILSSGYAEEQVMAGDHPERPQVFLGKPYQLVALLDALEKALGDDSLTRSLNPLPNHSPNAFLN